MAAQGRALAPRRGQVGLILLAIFAIMAIFGHVLASQDPNAASSFSTSAARPRIAVERALAGNRRVGAGRVRRAALCRADHARGRRRGRPDLDAARGAGRRHRGLLRRRVDRCSMALDDWVLVLPFIPTAIVIASLLGRSVELAARTRDRADLVIGGLGWAGTSRIVRSQVLTLQASGTTCRARACSGRLTARSCCATSCPA